MNNRGRFSIELSKGLFVMKRLKNWIFRYISIRVYRVEMTSVFMGV